MGKTEGVINGTYDDVKNAIQERYYSLLDAQGVLNAFVRQLQLTTEQYKELMELADKLLNPNNASDEESIEKVQNAITAYAGMTYYKDKYYKDPTDEQVYICTRDRDDQPGAGIALYHTPSQLVNIYFALAE